MPPTINRILPNSLKPTTVSQVAKADILDEIIDVSEIKNKFYKVCLYGLNRTGKTSTACEFPKPLLLVAAEPNPTGGALSVTHKEGVKYIKVDSILKLMTLAQRLKEESEKHGKCPYESIVIDSATSIQDIVLKEIMNLPAVPEMLSWGFAGEDDYRKRSEKTREALRPWFNLPAHIIVLAKERDHKADAGDRKPKIVKGETAESLLGADLGGATAGWLHDSADYLGRMYVTEEIKLETNSTFIIQNGKKVEKQITNEVKTGKQVHRIRTLFHSNILAGFRAPFLEDGTDGPVPEYIQGSSPRDMYEKIIKVIEGKKVEDGK